MRPPKIKKTPQSSQHPHRKSTWKSLTSRVSKRSNHSSHSNHHHKRNWIIGLSILLVLCLASLGLIEFEPSLVANFADNVLRPVIGNRATIALESASLSLSDGLKQLAYGTFAKPSANIYNPEPSATNVQAASLASKAAAANAREMAQALKLAPLNAFQPNLARLPGEGQWNLVGLPQFGGQPIMARTFVRPDPARSYAIVAVVQMNMHQLHLHSVAGTQHPGAILGHPGPGVIPASVLAANNLVVGFNGGFQYQDGKYGMVVGPTTYVPLRIGLGTLTIYEDGTLTIDRYASLAAGGKPIEAIRQNGPLILDRGAITPDVISGGYSVWGRTTTNSNYTWRSGIGLTSNGNLIYAVGPSLSAQTLAQSLKMAGATQAIQLDINAYWVRFVTFTPTGSGNYTYESILSTLANGGSSYLHGYNKDFFYATLEPAAK